MKWINLLIAILFAWFAYVQLNDPDPERWVAMYGSVAVLWALAAFNRYYLYVVYAVLVVSIFWMLSLFPDFVNWLQDGADSIVGSMKVEQPHIELTREFLGLVVVIVALLFLRRQARRNIGA